MSQASFQSPTPSDPTRDVPPPLPPTADVALPPTIPGAMTTDPAWRTPLGVICFIIGGLGAIVTLFGMFSPLLQGFFAAMDPSGAATASINATKSYLPILLGINFLNLCLAIVLLTLGFALAKRRRRAAKTARTYAVLKLLVSIVTIVVNLYVQRETMKAMQAATPGGMPPIMGTMAPLIEAFGILVSVIMYMTLPVFLLIWFSRQSVKQEVARWV